MTGRVKQSSPPAELESPGRACAGKGPDRFYQRDSERAPATVRRLIPVAREFCGSCVVLSVCRTYGSDSGEPGLWGGVLHIEPTSGPHRRISFDLLQPGRKVRLEPRRVPRG